MKIKDDPAGYVMNISLMKIVLAICVLCAFGAAKADSGISEWSSVERIVAIGDIHGDFAAFRQLLLETKLINKRNRWIGGKTHFVQVGDVPDRGPDSRKVMDLLMKLESQAAKAGGRVHALIGNHEAMNIIGDLRYVDAGEYNAFVDRKSRRRQQAYYENTVKYLQNTLAPEQLPTFDDAYKARWMERYPLGYVEHRTAWAPNGKYGRWVREHNSVIKINGTLFVHGGISPRDQGRSLDEMNALIRSELTQGDNLPDTALANDQLGPLWYRGLSKVVETCEIQDEINQLLKAYNAQRIVVAHTPVAGAILPRYNSRLIMVDVGLSAHYGGARAALVIEDDKLSVMHEGKLLSPLVPAAGYLENASSATTDAAPLFERFLKRLNGVNLDQALDCSTPHAEVP